MNTRKTTCRIGALLLLVALLTGCCATGLAQAAEPVRFKIMAFQRPQSGDFSQMECVKRACELFNVEIEWEMVTDDNYTEVKNLSLATGDMPDAYMSTLIAVSDIQNNPALFVPYTEEMLEHAPNFRAILDSDEETRNYLKLADGNIYSMPYVVDTVIDGFYDQFYINSAWLKTLGLEAPQTMEELEQVLLAFKNGDPNGNGLADEIPYTFIQDHSYFGLFTLYGAFGRLDNKERLFYEDGKVTFTADKDEWKNATRFFARMYAEGLIDPEGFTQDRATLFAKGKAETNVVGSLNAFLVQNVVGGERMANEYTYLLPFAQENGERVMSFCVNPVRARTRCVITTACQNVNRLVEFLDYFLEEKATIDACLGPVDDMIVASSDPAYKYEYDHSVIPEGVTEDEYRFQNSPDCFPVYIPKSVYMSIKSSGAAAQKFADLAICEPYLTTEWLPEVIFTDAETNELSMITSTIRDYVKQMQATWIAGQSDIDADWDGYVKTLNDMGLARYVQIYQDACDRYNGVTK